MKYLPDVTSLYGVYMLVNLLFVACATSKDESCGKVAAAFYVLVFLGAWGYTVACYFMIEWPSGVDTFGALMAGDISFLSDEPDRTLVDVAFPRYAEFGFFKGAVETCMTVLLIVV